MARINSRRKGKRGEKYAVQLLTKWTKRKFASTPASGGLHWQNQFVAGDVVCVKEGHYFPFCIEVKFYEKIDFSHLIAPNVKNCDILDFFKQASTDAKRVGKIPIVMMRYNSLPKEFFYVVVPNKFVQDLRLGGVSSPLRVDLLFRDKDKELQLAMFRSDQFFGMNYKKVKTIAKTYIKELYGNKR